MLSDEKLLHIHTAAIRKTKDWHVLAGLRAVAEAAVKDAVGGDVAQYYYKDNNCLALDPFHPDCICWHDEGTGPNPDPIDARRTWRNKSRPQASAAVPEKKTGPIARTLEGYGYVNGWNDCIDALLAASQPEVKNAD